MADAIRTAISALASASELSGTCRSAKTFPDPSRTSPARSTFFLLGLFLPVRIVLLSSLEPLLYQLDLFRRCLDAALGLLLKRVEHIDGARETDCVDGAIAVAVVIFDDLQHVGADESLQGFRVRVLPS